MMEKVFKELPKSLGKSILIKEEIAHQFAGPFHFHKGYEMTYIVKGGGKFYGGNKIMNFYSDELYFFGIGFPHLFVNDKSFVDKGEMGHSIIIQFPEDLFIKNLSLIPEFKLANALLKTSKLGVKISNKNHRLDQLKEAFIRITKEDGLSTIITLLKILDFTSQIPTNKLKIIRSEAFKKIDKDSVTDEKLKPVFQHILENFKEDIKLRDIAKMAFMNDTAFCRYFKRRTGKTLSQFVNQVRITHALYLLTDKTKSISEVCYESGFGNLSYFNLQFKSITNKTPTQYQREIEKES